MLYVKQQILFYHSKGFRVPLLPRNFKKKASRRGIHKFITLYSSSGRICRRHGSGWPSKITAEIRSIVDLQMTTTVSNTRLAAFLQLTKHVSGINGFLRRSSVWLSELKVMVAQNSDVIQTRQKVGVARRLLYLQTFAFLSFC